MFLCFSSGDRYTAAKSCLYHLKNYGIPVWYDYHELILGDCKREKNFEHAIKSNKYFIIIYSKDLFKSPCAIEEEKIIFEQYLKNDAVIFPLIYNMRFEELPLEYRNKLENLIYNEITDSTGTLNSINQIITKILIDKINSSTFDITPTLENIDTNQIVDDYLCELISCYKNISKENFNARISLMFCIIKYIKTKYKIDDENIYLYSITEYLCKFTNLNIEYNHKELIIAELSLILLFRIIF